jgi:hypothetical protein
MVSKSGVTAAGHLRISTLPLNSLLGYRRFELYLVTEFKRLKREEQQRLSLEWNFAHSVENQLPYHTDAIRTN